MNNDDLRQMRDLVSDIVAPVGASAADAARAAKDAISEVRALRVDVNGGDGHPGLKERLAAMEATCTARHGAVDTQQTIAINAELAKRTLARLETQPRSLAPADRAMVRIASWKAAAMIVTALAGVAGSYFLGRSGAPANPTPPALATPAR